MINIIIPDALNSCPEFKKSPYSSQSCSQLLSYRFNTVWMEVILPAVCLSVLVPASVFNSHTLYPFTWSIVKDQLIYSVYMCVCVCLKVSESQHLLQGRHLVSFTHALSVQSSTHPCDRMTHRNRDRLYILHASYSVLGGIEFWRLCVFVCVIM